MRSKYGNKKTVVDNITFDSMKEAGRYGQLKLLVKAGKITDLELQPKYAITVNGQKICTYVGDFRYVDVEGSDLFDAARGIFKWVIEDVKGMKTPVYNLKKKLMKAVHGIEIQEV